MSDELYYRMALTMIPDLGPIRAKFLVERFGDAKTIFSAKKKDLASVESIGAVRAKCLKEWNAFDEVEKEISFTEKHQIDCLFLTDKSYPQRLLHCYDPPTLLYYRGNANLNHPKIVSIIGTRNHTEYGKQVTELLTGVLASHQVLVVSGLAFGIDAVAHRSALQSGLSTVGVLAHGMDTLYPSQHKSLAKEMLLQGGLVTEFRRSHKPDKHNFPKRNRIVAGMADATIVIETAVKGGSMITAELAYNYNRDLFAIPGRINDPKSMGCLKLVSQNKAVLLTGPEQLVELMGWEPRKKPPSRQKELFIELSDDEKIIVRLLKEKDFLPIDEIYLKSGLSSSSVAAAILNLELQNVITSLPGKLYALE
ncbi:MAG: dprA [Sediminibacterium sp.]|nr:dprA [Sediminibacterium sp.]